MFAKLVVLLAVAAVAIAAPRPVPAPGPAPAPAPGPAPQYITYSAGLDYVYPAGVASVVSPYTAPLAYSATFPGTFYVR